MATLYLCQFYPTFKSNRWVYFAINDMWLISMGVMSILAVITVNFKQIPKICYKLRGFEYFMFQGKKKRRKRIKKKSLPRISNTKKINWKKIDVLFAALPNGEGQKIAKKLPINVKLIDLSADFRLKDSKAYKKWYGKNNKSKQGPRTVIVRFSFYKDK